MRVDGLKESFEILRQQGHSSRLMASEGSNFARNYPHATKNQQTFKAWECCYWTAGASMRNDTDHSCRCVPPQLEGYRYVP